MTYVGATPTTGDFKKLDSITTSSATTFNLRQGGVAVYPQSANHCIVSLNGVIQAHIDAFTIVNDTIVFASSLASSDVINFILVLGNVNDIGVPSDSSVSLAKLTATGTASSSTFLRGDNSWASAGLSDWSENSGNLLPSNASYGIYLGVNSATATNLLHDYEEGELSNALMIDSTTQTSYSSGRANLQYTKIGRIVHCQALIDTDGQTLATTGVVKLRLPFATSDGSGTAMAGGTPFISPSVNGAIFPSRLYLDENVTSAPMNKIQSKGNGNYAEFGEQASVSNTSHRIYIHVCFSYQTDA